MTTSLASLRGISGANKWVSGRSYGVDAIVWSPATKLLYVRTGAAAVSTTDPSADAGNWAPWAASGVKGVQRGKLSIYTISGTGLTFDATVSAVNTSKASLSVIGFTKDPAFSAEQTQAYLELINSTTIRATRLSSGGGGGTAATYSWELIEYW